jgi:hypothetical protein
VVAEDGCVLWDARLTLCSPQLHTQSIGWSLRLLWQRRAAFSTAVERDPSLRNSPTLTLDHAVRRARAVRVLLCLSGPPSHLRLSMYGEDSLPAMSTTLVAAERGHVGAMLLVSRTHLAIFRMRLPNGPPH